MVCIHRRSGLLDGDALGRALIRAHIPLEESANVVQYLSDAIRQTESVRVYDYTEGYEALEDAFDEAEWG